MYLLLYQLVYLTDEFGRRKVLNVGKVIVPAVVRHNIVAASGLGALVLQHILKVLHGLCDGRHHLLLSKVDYLHHAGHLAQCIVLLALRPTLDDVRQIGKGERRGKQ